MLMLPRGDPRWKGYSNQGECPEGGLPLWVVMDPLLWGRNQSERTLITERIAAHPFLYHYLNTSRDGMLYVSIDGRKPTRSERLRLRREIYHLLPSGVTTSLPPEIRRKYGSKNEFPCAA